MRWQKGNASATPAASLNFAIPNLIIERVIDDALAQISAAQRQADSCTAPKESAEQRDSASRSAKEFAKKEFEIHRPDFRYEYKLLEIIWPLTFASYYENLGSGGTQLHWYSATCDMIISSRELNNGNIKWADGLIKKAQEGYELMKKTSGGNGDIHFELSESAGFVAGLSKLKESDIQEVNDYIDLQVSRYGTPKMDKAALKKIVDYVFKGLLIIKQLNYGKYDLASTELLIAAQEALALGARDWANELIAEIKVAHGLYSDWCEVQIRDPYKDERRYIMSNLTSAQLKIDDLAERANRQDPTEAIRIGSGALARLRRRFEYD